MYSFRKLFQCGLSAIKKKQSAESEHSNHAVAFSCKQPVRRKRAIGTYVRETIWNESPGCLFHHHYPQSGTASENWFRIMSGLTRNPVIVRFIMRNAWIIRWINNSPSALCLPFSYTYSCTKKAIMIIWYPIQNKIDRHINADINTIVSFCTCTKLINIFWCTL